MAQARIDWGYNAMDQVTMLAKEIIGKSYGKAPQYSYYVGNSSGGRQGMMMAQRFPQYFDSIVSGAPILGQHLAQIGSMQTCCKSSPPSRPRTPVGSRCSARPIPTAT